MEFDLGQKFCRRENGELTLVPSETGTLRILQVVAARPRFAGGARGEVGAFEGARERLSGAVEHGGSPFSQGEDQVTSQPVSEAISPLRRRMLEDMAMRGMHGATQRDYVRFVQSFAAFLRRPLDTVVHAAKDRTANTSATV